MTPALEARYAEPHRRYHTRRHIEACLALLDEWPEIPPREATPMRGSHPLSGATLANLSPALAEELGLSEVPPRGVIITELRRGTPAAQIRLQPGDVVLRINDREVRTVEDARRIATSLALPWRLAIRRGERVINLVVGG